MILRRPETRPGEWQEQAKNTEKPEEKPDLFRKPEHVACREKGSKMENRPET